MSNEPKQPEITTFDIEIKPISMKGQVLLIVWKNGERGHTPYMTQQMPQDFAEYVLKMHNDNKIRSYSTTTVRLVPIDGGPKPL